MSASDPYFAQALVAAERAARNGMPITAESLVSEDPSLPIQASVDLTSDERFARALEEMGINFTPFQKLSNDQLAAIHLYLSDSSRSHAAKLRAAGISQTKWAGWMRQPIFKEYIARHAEDALFGALPATHLALADKATHGEAWAVNLLYGVTGFYDPNKVDDPRKYFEAIFEVLSDEGVSAAILQKVAGRIREISDPAASVANRQQPAMIVASPTRSQEAS